MKTVTRRWIGRVGALLAGALVSACLSPTLPPFPPPSEPQTMTYLPGGQLRLQGILVEERATVFALNWETGEYGGKLVKDGTYTFTVPAQPGDEIELWYVVGGDESGSLYFDAPEAAVELPDAGANTDAGVDAGTLPDVDAGTTAP